MNTILSYKSRLPKPVDKKTLKDLFIKMQTGDLKAREEIIKHNSRLIILVIERMVYDLTIDREELFSIGMIGLIKAVDTFNLESDTVFASYAIACIKNELLMYFRKERKIKNREIEIVNDEEDEFNIIDNIKDDSIDFVLDYELKDNYKIIREIVDSLPPNEKLVITGYYGIGKNTSYNMTELGKMLGISKQYIFMIKERALKRIKKRLLKLNIIEVHEDKIIKK